MAEVDNYTFSSISDENAAFHIVGADLATMELVCGEALDPTALFIDAPMNMEDVAQRSVSLLVEPMNDTSSQLEKADITSSTINDDLQRSEPGPEEVPKKIETNTPSVLINNEATIQAKEILDPSVESTSIKPIDENSVSQQPKTTAPIISKRNSRKASQRGAEVLAAERPTKKIKSLADLTPEQLDVIMERAELTEYLVIGDTESLDAKNSTLENFPNQSLDAEAMTRDDQQNPETVENISQVEISKENVESEQNKKNLRSRRRTTSLTDKEAKNEDPATVDLRQEESSPHNTTNRPNATLAKAMKEALKALNKTQRQWAHEVDLPEVELSKYFNDYYNARGWTSFEAALKTWLKKHAPSDILRKYNALLCTVEDGSATLPQQSVEPHTNDNIKDGTDHHKPQEVMTNNVEIMSSISEDQRVNTRWKKPTKRTDKRKVPLAFHEVLVLDLLQELIDVKNSSSLSTTNCISVTESVRNMKIYMHGVTKGTRASNCHNVLM